VQGDKKDNLYFTHGGANEGFRCLLVAYENSGDGAVIMTNSDAGSGLADEIIHSIAVEYGWPDFRPVERTSVPVDPTILARYLGTYEIAKGFNLVVTLEQGQLMTQATGQEKVPIYAESETKFFPTVMPADIEFVKDDHGMVTQLILRQGGREMKAPKK